MLKNPVQLPHIIERQVNQLERLVFRSGSMQVLDDVVLETYVLPHVVSGLEPVEHLGIILFKVKADEGVEFCHNFTFVHNCSCYRGKYTKLSKFIGNLLIELKFRMCETFRRRVTYISFVRGQKFRKSAQGYH